MKNSFLFPLACCLFLGACAPSRTSVNVQYNSNEEAHVNVGYETFYHELSPYGRWIDYPGYGYVWVPNAGADFRPYATGGHWVFTNYGWTWVSTYSWGWAPFHYGRWLYEDGYGWIWVPGHEWAPAWVTWGSSGGYYGWAPLAPGIHVSVSSGWTPPAHYWNFVPAQHITQVNVNNYVTNTTNNVTVVNNITKNVTIINNNNVTNNNITNNNVTNNNVTNNNITNNNINNRSTTVYNMGPARNEVERAVSHPIQPVTLTESKQPGAASLSNNQLMVYRPRVQQAAATGPKPAPEKVEAYHPSKPMPVNPGGPIIRENANNAGARVNVNNNNHEEKPNTEMNRNALMEEKKPVPSPVMPKSDAQNQVKIANRENPGLKTERPGNDFNQKPKVKDDKTENRNLPPQARMNNAKAQANVGAKVADKPNGKRKKKKEDLRSPR
jgi:hypothetical protein